MDVYDAYGARYTHVDQCMYGQRVQKATTFMTFDQQTEGLERHCTCNGHERTPVLEPGRRGERRQFTSAKLARYPVGLAKEIGKLAVAYTVQPSEDKRQVRARREAQWHHELFPPGLAAAVKRQVEATQTWQL